MTELTVKTKVTEGGRIVIPAKMREAMGIKVGRNVTLTMKNDTLEISTRDKTIRKINEMMKPYIVPGRSVVDDLIAERRQEAENE